MTSQTQQSPPSSSSPLLQSPPSSDDNGAPAATPATATAEKPAIERGIEAVLQFIRHTLRTTALVALRPLVAAGRIAQNPSDHLSRLTLLSVYALLAALLGRYFFRFLADLSRLQDTRQIGHLLPMVLRTPPPLVPTAVTFLLLVGCAIASASKTAWLACLGKKFRSEADQLAIDKASLYSAMLIGFGGQFAMGCLFFLLVIIFANPAIPARLADGVIRTSLIYAMFLPALVAVPALARTIPYRKARARAPRMLAIVLASLIQGGLAGAAIWIGDSVLADKFDPPEVLIRVVSNISPQWSTDSNQILVSAQAINVAARPVILKQSFGLLLSSGAKTYESPLAVRTKAPPEDILLEPNQARMLWLFAAQPAPLQGAARIDAAISYLVYDPRNDVTLSCQDKLPPIQYSRPAK